jgi:Putative zinc ribbon domain
MPMEKAEAFAMGDESKDYCVHCAREDGSMRSYDEAVEGMSQFMIKTQGFEKNAATKAVKEMMAKLPAWKDED